MEEELIRRAIRQLETFPRLVPGPVSGEGHQLWAEFQEAVRQVRDQARTDLVDHGVHEYDRGLAQGIEIASHHCPECGASACKVEFNEEDDACWGGESTLFYVCPNGHEWE